ncbi:MAG: COX15/CtaA family protein [Bradyrhizobium sp.]|uniref:COX15/CtaA family protein n=1 Tax=Bradyrhizobium sp. TaxID=376 RepID=UPI003533DF92
MQGLSASPASSNTAVRWWLIGVAALIALMVLVGGATRLTESGLSIVEWKPVTGTLPPLTDAQWQEAFEGYKKIPQYRELNAGMTLAEFKTIFWWEWAHRLLGRFIGVAYLLPFIYFLWRGALGTELKRRLWVIFALGGLQGAVGWWMVASGLTQRTEVSQYRLAAHLILALVIFAAIVWTVRRMRVRTEVTAPLRLKFFGQLLLGLTFLQIYFGALVAGLRAGRAYNTWPEIDGAFIPSAGRLFFETPWWRNLFDNVLTVQFEHRMTAYLLLAVAVWHAIDTVRARTAGAVMRGAWWLAAAVLVQGVLGILTLIQQVPIDLALAHQAVAIVVLTIAIVNVERLSPYDARATSERLASAGAG